jgi:predicted metal-dependent phosphotriesterase family hydrolase
MWNTKCTVLVATSHWLDSIGHNLSKLICEANVDPFKVPLCHLAA